MAMLDFATGLGGEGVLDMFYIHNNGKTQTMWGRYYYIVPYSL